MTLAGWLYLAAPLSVAFAFMLSTGPHLQLYIFSAINSDAPDIYSAAYQNAIAPFPELVAWLSSAGYWLFVMIGTCAAVMCLKANSLRGVVASAAVWIAGLLTLADFVAALFGDGFVLTDQIANVTANVVGGTAAAFLAGLALFVSRLTQLTLAEHKTAARVCGIAVLVLSGVVISTSTFYALRHVYEPLPVRVDLTLDAPVDGLFSADPRFTKAWPREDRGQKPAKRFTFLPSSETSGGLQIISPRGTMEAKWSKLIPTAGYELEVRLVTDCMLESPENIERGPPILTVGDLHTFHVAFDEGQNFLRAAAGERRFFDFEQDDVNSYRLETSSEGAAWEATLFADRRDRLTVSSSSDLVFVASASAFGKDAESDAFRSRPRRITLRANDTVWSLHFRQAHFTEDRQIECRTAHLPVSLATSGSEVDVPLPGGETSVGLLTTIRQRPSPEFIAYMNPESSLTISDVNGWLTLSKIGDDVQDQGVPRSLTFLSAEGNIPQMTVEGASRDVRVNTHIVMWGELLARYSTGGQTRVNGTAFALWLDSARLNPTRWERLPSEWRLGLLGLMLTAIAAIGRWAFTVFRTVGDRDVKEWFT